jgi:hypothetical protein
LPISEQYDAGYNTLTGARQMTMGLNDVRKSQIIEPSPH